MTVVVVLLVVIVGIVLLVASVLVSVVFGPRRFVNLVTSFLKLVTSFRSSSFSYENQKSTQIQNLA